jgi:hypothetical protein
MLKASAAAMLARALRPPGGFGLSPNTVSAAVVKHSLLLKTQFAPVASAPGSTFTRWPMPSRELRSMSAMHLTFT